MGARGTCNRVRDEGSGYLVTLRERSSSLFDERRHRWIHGRSTTKKLPITPIQNVSMQRVQDVKMQREDSAQLQRE